MSEWIEQLRELCKENSQRSMAKKMGYSATVINMVLNGGYSGDLKAVEMAFNGAFCNQTHACKVVGEISANECLKQQRMGFSANNPQRVAFYKACRGGCQHYLKGGEA